MLGQAVGSYRITRRIGEGGMGAVYLAEHTLLGRTAAIKVLHPELSHQPEIVERFFNEARSASAIRHPGIVEIFDFGYAENDAAYIVMEHLAGESLRDRLDNALTLDPIRAASLTRQLASALQAAHDEEIIHRDLKPDNVFIVPDQEVFGGERAKILDFGIAKLAASKGGSFRTQTGQLFGTPTYMAPEQCRGAGRVDRRADLYALGCMLYEMVCGRPPFVGEGGGEVLAAQIYEEAEAPRELAPHIPEALETILLKLLEKDPEARYSSAQEVAEDLQSQVASTAQLGSGPVQTPTPPPVRRTTGDAVRTTLASAASATISSPPESVAPNRARRRAILTIALGATAAVAIGVVSVVFLSADGGPASEGAQQVATPDARSQTAPTITELPATDAGEAAVVELETDAGPSLAVVHLDSAPPGAEVYALPGREMLGTTPLAHEAPASGQTLALALERNGFRTEHLELVLDGDIERTVELTRERRRQRTRPTTRQPPRDREAEDRAEEPSEAETEKSTEPERDREEGPLNPFTRDRGDNDDEALNPFDR